MRFWPGFKILDRYILGKFLSTYFFAILMILVVTVVFDYVEKVDNFTRYNAPLEAIIFDYYLNFVPSFINQLSGLFTFISVIFFTSKMAYQTEIIAMLSAGMSFRRLMWPYFIGSFVIASLSLVLNLWIVPVSQRTCVAFETQYIDGIAEGTGSFDKNIYRQIEPGAFLYLRGYQATGRAAFLALDRFENGELVASLEAERPYVDSVSGRWQASRYTTRTFIKGREVFEQRPSLDTLLNLDRTELARVEDYLKTLKIGELNEFYEQQIAKGSDSIVLIEVARHSRFAYPVGAFILALIGVSLSSRKVRGGTGLHIGVGIGLCFLYIVFIRFAEEFAKGGALSPEVAVWMPNVIYFFIAIYCYRKAPK